MEFITGEQFLKEDKEVQEVINNSIKLCIGDRIYNYIDNRYYIFLGKEGRCYRVCDLKNKRIGLFANDVFIKSLTETDLRQFIEDKEKCVIKVGTAHARTKNKINYFFILDYYIAPKRIIRNLGNNLLQAYWKVAVQIARESIDR